MAKRKKNASFGKKRSEGSAEAYNEKIKEEQKNINKKAALIIFAGFLGLVAFCFLLYFISTLIDGRNVKIEPETSEVVNVDSSSGEVAVDSEEVTDASESDTAGTTAEETAEDGDVSEEASSMVVMNEYITEIESVGNDGFELFEAEDRPLADMAPAERANYYSETHPFGLADDLTYDAILKTSVGDIRLRLFADLAPETVNNFVNLSLDGFYDGLIFHRVISNFMVQGGDPTGTGSSGPGYSFQDEVNNGLEFDRRGLLAMANSGPATNGSQFFITHNETPHLNDKHTIFGYLVDGEDAFSLIPDSTLGEEPIVIESVDIMVK